MDLFNQSPNSRNTYNFWRKCMIFGEHAGCHQLPERSFFIGTYQMPVCARCTGVIIGYIFALPVSLIFPFPILLSVSGCICMLTDWMIQALKLKASTNTRRLLTGVLGGLGIMSIEVSVIKYAIHLVQNYI